MDYRDYIKQEHCGTYVQERENLADRLIEAKYNLLFLKMAHQRDVAYRNRNNYARERFEIRFILKRIYTTIAWELSVQIKAFIDDDGKECLTINKFKNNIYNYYLKIEKRQEYCALLKTINEELKKNACNEIVKAVSNYRNKIVAHNVLNSPDLTFNISDADTVISQYEKMFSILSFQNETYMKRVSDLYDEKREFIVAYLDAVLPLK